MDFLKRKSRTAGSGADERLWYAQSILLFPSYLETVGLPICEAMSVHRYCPIVVRGCGKRNTNIRYFI